MRKAEAEQLAKRQASPSSTSTPPDLSTFAPSILSSACSAEVTRATSTSTIQTTVTSSVVTILPSTGPAPTVTSTVQAVTVVNTISSGVTTTTSTVSTTVTRTSTTTVVVASGAPTGTQTYLQAIPNINPGGVYALSDPAPHMTDNYFYNTTREIFILTSTSQLYSVTHNAYYYRQTPVTTSGKLFWNSNSSYGETIFTGVYNTTLGYNELIATDPSTKAQYLFCTASAPGTDYNSATGYHHYFATSSANYPSTCQTTRLFLQPINLAP